MRMWLVPPAVLCQQHLLGEHVEMHMFAGTIRKGRSIQGYIDQGLVEVGNLYLRHNELAKEMAQRGMNHQSPMPFFILFDAGHVDIDHSLAELQARCENCAGRIREMGIETKEGKR